MTDDVIDAHLARCPDCARFAEVADREHRGLRVRAADPVPDLTREILERISSLPSPPPAAGAPGGLGALFRSGLARRRVMAIAAAATVVVGGGVGVGGLLSQEAGPSHAATRYPGAVVTDNSIPKPSVVLTDTSGRPYDVARATAGRVTLVYFGYTHCPDICPMNMALMAATLRELPASQRREVTVVFITTDPKRDTRPVIRAWLDRFDRNFVGLTGSPAAIHAAEVGVQMPLSYKASGGYDESDADRRSTSADETRQDYQVVHAGYTLVYARDGVADLTVDDAVPPHQFATTLRHVLSYGYRGPS